MAKRWQVWTWRGVVQAALVGWIVAAHWVTFFASIKASSVGLALTMLATAPLFVGFIEPVVFGRRIALRELAVAAMVFLGIALVFDAEQDQCDGHGAGADERAVGGGVQHGQWCFGAPSRPHQPERRGVVVSQCGHGVVVGARGQWGARVWTMSTSDWVWIAVLAVVATSFAFMVSIQVLKKLTPFESAMAINLEPIYAIVLAYVLFDERFSPGFYAGAALVICAVFADTLLRSRGRGTASKQSDPQ